MFSLKPRPALRKPGDPSVGHHGHVPASKSSHFSSQSLPAITFLITFEDIGYL
jgi:hypothetical protein